jgi:hypothetical protein
MLEMGTIRHQINLGRLFCFSLRKDNTIRGKYFFTHAITALLIQGGRNETIM